MAVPVAYSKAGSNLKASKTIDETYSYAQLQSRKEALTKERDRIADVAQKAVDKIQAKIDEVDAMILEAKNLKLDK